jgi:hypothetical protein
LAGECDLARIVWRSGPDDLVIVERRRANLTVLVLTSPNASPAD